MFSLSFLQKLWQVAQACTLAAVLPCLAPVVWPLNVPDLIKGWQVCGTFSSAWWRWFWLVSGFILWLVGSLQRCFDFMCAQEAEYSLCSGGKGALWFLSFQFRCQFSHDLTFPRYAYIKTLAVPPASSLTHTQKEPFTQVHLGLSAHT